MPNDVYRDIGDRIKDTEDEVVAVLRQTHVEREEQSMALSDLLKRGGRLTIKNRDRRAVAQRLASRKSAGVRGAGGSVGNVRSRRQKRLCAMGEAGRIARANHKNGSG